MDIDKLLKEIEANSPEFLIQFEKLGQAYYRARATDYSIEIPRAQFKAMATALDAIGYEIRKKPIGADIIQLRREH
jgi:hypothetical protein